MLRHRPWANMTTTNDDGSFATFVNGFPTSSDPMDATSMYENISVEENSCFDEPDADAAAEVDNNNNPRGDTYAERAARGVEMDNSTSEQ